MSWFSRFWTWLRGIDLDHEVAVIQALTVKCCGFLPTAATVSNIIFAGNPTVITATAIAAAICEAVKTKHTVSALLAGELPTVNGVVIEGEFVK